ncbi:hypothetical protein FHT87_003773 [Rhizobium sp. BK316]|uniref:hypothetical protein n=1 Tax=Rhizobium sp. BK316 TaxID=2587053 RepID=UPI00162232A7|nr:hypothetical protein [Rhizobium sp. BK316]MBB3409854.1 hypothetical protein [Rhizobium sp. BK316]
MTTRNVAGIAGDADKASFVQVLLRPIRFFRLHTVLTTWHWYYACEPVTGTDGEILEGYVMRRREAGSILYRHMTDDEAEACKTDLHVLALLRFGGV